MPRVLFYGTPADNKPPAQKNNNDAFYAAPAPKQPNAAVQGQTPPSATTDATQGKDSKNPLNSMLKKMNAKREKDPSNLTGEKDNNAQHAIPLPLLEPEEDKEDTDIMDKLKAHGENKALQIVHDEGFQPIEISLKDITRIVCFTDITSTVYSKEKNIEIKTEGKDAFIKNLPVETYDPATGRGALKYDAKKKEIYVICGGRTFSLLLVPRDIPATTVYLKMDREAKEKATKYEQASDYENVMIRLINDIYKENIPDGYDIAEVNKLAANYAEADVLHKRTYTGDTFQVYEYIVYAKQAVNLDEISLLELLKVKNPLAITSVDVILEPKQQTRIFVVRFNNE